MYLFTFWYEFMLINGHLQKVSGIIHVEPNKTGKGAETEKLTYAPKTL